MSIFRFLLFQMARTQNIIPTAPGGMRKKSMRNEEQVRQRPVTALSLLVSGQMQITL
jgi:hypothetical protein